MAVYDKVQRSLLGKCCLPSRGAALTEALQGIGGKVIVLYPAAWNYDNLVGTIWLEDTSQYSYDNRGSGEIEIREPSGEDALGEVQGGYYDNR